ncbi:hypothetical protein [Niastella vici]|uniref:hypothetical protein n=1 Tax=Niastella vici TaxID=1703345 RepID=UPI00117F3972|nr:hypothetical protein [Niastella vici]
MLTTKRSGEDHVTVIPFCPHCACHFRNPVIVYKLCFWFNDKLDHVVTEQSVQQFLLQANLYGATIYPDYPELGCYAINTDEQFSPAGKTRVSEIHYRGHVIYSRSKQLH